MLLILDMSPILESMIDISNIDHQYELLNSLLDFLINENNKDTYSLINSYNRIDSIMNSYGISHNCFDLYINQINSIIYNCSEVIQPIFSFYKRLLQSTYMLRIDNGTLSIAT